MSGMRDRKEKGEQNHTKHTMWKCTVRELDEQIEGFLANVSLESQSVLSIILYTALLIIYLVL